MFCHVALGFLPQFLHVELGWLLAVISSDSSLFAFYVWVLCIALSCLAIGQSASLLKQSEYNLHSEQEYSTADEYKKGSDS